MCINPLMTSCIDFTVTLIKSLQLVSLIPLDDINCTGKVPLLLLFKQWNKKHSITSVETLAPSSSKLHKSAFTNAELTTVNK